MSIENFILFGSIITLLLLLGFIGFAAFQQKRFIKLQNEQARLEKIQEEKLTEAVIESQEKVRKKIGEELHDEISPFLLSAIRNLNMISQQYSSEDKSLRRINKIRENVEISMKMLKEVAHILHPSDLDDTGLLLILQDFCVFIENSMDCRLDVFTKLKELTIEQSKQLMLYRIVQELIINAINHGNAKLFKISIFENENQLNLVVFHNGSLFLKKDYLKGLQSITGLGLKNIQQRLNLLKGEIIFYSN